MFRNFLCMLVAGLWLALLTPIALIVMVLCWNTDVSIWMARHLWAPPLLWVGGARLSVEGLENVDPKRPTIYVSNHQSTIDIPILFVALPVNVRFIAKKQLMWVPFLGLYMLAARYIFVDRANRAKAMASLDKAGQRIRTGTSIIVFPEGTRSPDGLILPFKKGSFALALKAQVPICPVTIEGSGSVMPKNSWRISPGTIHVRIGKPIDVSVYSEDERDALSREVRGVVIAQSLAMGGRGGAPDGAMRPPMGMDEALSAPGSLVRA